MDYKKVLRLHYVNNLSGREIADSCGDCSKSAVNEFLRRFRECQELSYPLKEDVTNEYIESLLYKKSGVSVDLQLYRDFNKEAVYKALARKGETLKHLWQKYNAVGVVDGKKPYSYRQYCRRYSEWTDSKHITFHIQRYPGVNLELDYAGKQLLIHNRRYPNETTKVTIFIAALTYSDYFYAEGMIDCDIRNWIRVNNNALDFFGGITPTITPDNCKVAVNKNKDWISPELNKDYQAYGDYGYWNVPYFQQKASKIGPSTRALIDAVIKRYAYPVQAFRSCFGILRYAEKYSPEALEKCCRDAINFGKCNYSYVSNTVSTYHTETKPDATDVFPENQEAVTGRYKDDDSQYSLKNLLMRQEKEAHHED